ncbi:DUF1285 domain-containing protein [Polymorphobacter sp.]|uniref:DUF1285 domain-containing protein n=1 Tax=Polymorphobacter sp. TaxID=1909290 RepID=UPI003F6FB222
MADPASSLDMLSSVLQQRALPPVHLWNPDRCGDSEMRIAVDGTWFHQGTPIGRPALVKLFSTILRREADGGHVLVTPHEKLDIEVEDAPFVAVAVESHGKGADRTLVFRLNTEDLVIAGSDHGLRIEQAEDGTPRPYLHVRAGLQALINRPVFYELADIALAEAPDAPGLWSGGVFYPFLGSG